MNLTEIILNILRKKPMNHAKLVRSVLENGYEASNLSLKIHNVVKELVSSGVISKNTTMGNTILTSQNSELVRILEVAHK